MYHIIWTKKHGIEIVALIYNRELLGTFMSEHGANIAKFNHRMKMAKINNNNGGI